MGGFSINGVKTGGSLHQLKDGVTPAQAAAAGKADGKDQAYFEHEGKTYVIEGENLDLSGIDKTERGKLPKAQVELGGKLVDVEVKEFENEVSVHNFREVVLSKPTGPAGYIRVAGGATLGVASVMVLGEKLMHGLNHLPFVSPNAGAAFTPNKVLAGAAVVGLGLVAAGTIAEMASAKSSDNPKLDALKAASLGTSSASLGHRVGSWLP